MAKLGQEPAFAIPGNDYKTEGASRYHPKQQGMSKRFYAACAAMQGLCVGKITSEIKKGECVDIAEMSYIIADELLKQEND